MGLEVKLEKSAGGIPVFQNTPEIAQGGFTLDITGLTLGAVVPAGTVMGFDEATRKAAPLKVAKLQADATNVAVAYQVEKGSLVIVGDNLAAVVGGKAYPVTVIDKTNAAYDVLTVGTTLGVALTAGTGLFISSATGAAAAVYATAAKGLLYQETKVAVNEPVAIAIHATVYARRIPVVTPEIKALLPQISFSQSF